MIIGQTVAHYELQCLLGEGGSGAVWRARDLRLDREVAVKVLSDALRDDELAWGRLLREARLASQLNHPHIASIYDLGEDDNHAYIVMEYVEGLTLADLIPDGGMPLEQLLRYAGQICDALSFAHKKGTLHGDLKGSNIMVTPEGNLKLLDFGLGRRVPRGKNAEVSSSSAALSESGATAGTLPFLAPEVLRGEDTSLKSDVWSLGVTLYQMATGVLPFRGETTVELGVEILMGSVDFSKVPETLRPALQGAIERDVSRRIGSAEDLLQVIQNTKGNQLLAAAKAARPRLPSHIFQSGIAQLRRRKLGVAIVATALGIGLAVVLSMRRERPVPSSAQPLDHESSLRKAKAAGVENPEATVWVNSDSGIYHCLGTRWYGKTHVGKYLKQKEARAEGDHPSGNRPCT